ncbi:MAG: hypothetical protein H7338_16000 [Candidatus Sericytochromatia bacterium]|nr:hypothetical protein [Candidatus Sericytochromatia bacterium]
MLERMLVVMMAAGLMAGCGAPMVAPMASLPVARVQAATAGLVLTGGSQASDPSPSHSQTYTVTGTQGGRPFKLTVKTANIWLYISRAEKISLNGVVVPQKDWKSLANDLSGATTSTQTAQRYASEVGTIIHFSSDRAQR